MDLLETIARSLAEELKPPPGTTLTYTKATMWVDMVQHSVVMHANPGTSGEPLMFVTMNRSGLSVISASGHHWLDYNDPRSIDRLQEILDARAKEYR